MPLAWLIEKFDGPGEKERRALRFHDRLRPGVLEFETALWIVESHVCLLSFDAQRLEPKICDFPLLQNRHLQVGGVNIGASQGSWNPGLFFVGVPLREALHLILVRLARPGCLLVVHPHLAELQPASMESRYIGNPNVSRCCR